jgi:FkbM family methyltransferase
MKKILVHTSFIGKSGYNNHARSFFTELSKRVPLKIRNYSIGDTWTGYSDEPHNNEEYFDDSLKELLILQTLHNSDGSRSDFPIYGYKNDYDADIHIVLNEVNHYYFYDDYKGYKIAYNVWESTEYPQDFFNRLFYFNEVWVPSQWQKENLIKQGYPENRIYVVPEGVDGKIFNPKNNIENDIFTFLLFGRWEYRKSTTEIIETFSKTFDKNESVKLIISADNPYSSDGTSSAKEKIKKLNINTDNIEIIDFPSRDEYVEYLRNGNVFVSCSRGEGWNLPLMEAMACGIPSIYTNWGAQLQYTDNSGIPVNVLHEVSAKNQNSYFVGNYIEPDFDDLSLKMRNVYENYDEYRKKALIYSEKLLNDYNWGKIVDDMIERVSTDKFVFITTGNLEYMSVIEGLVKSLNEFSKVKIIVYGVNCDIPFEYPNLIKKTINPPKHSIYDKWYWKQYACIESLKENYDYFIWIDGDTIVNANIDNVVNYFNMVENYPISDIHHNEEFFGTYQLSEIKYSQLFNEHLSEYMNVKKQRPYMHICFFIYNKKCEWWFNEILDVYKKTELDEYKKYLLWNDEGIDNVLRWKYGFTKHLPLSNFDTSSYEGLDGYSDKTLDYFYTFFNKDGPHNFNNIYNLQLIPKNKQDILYFHGNKDRNNSEKMIEYLKLIKSGIINSKYFFTEKNKLKNLGEIDNVQGSTLSIADKYGWDYAIYHEIYNLRDYYNNREKRINEGDIVVDLGANIGIFSRWAYSEGAGKIISFEPNKRYYELLKLNTSNNIITFNAAVSNQIGTIKIFDSSHLGGSNIFGTSDDNEGYEVRTYTLDYLFESNLIDKIDFLKIDVEGAEHLVFDGISDNNLLKVGTIAMEYHNSHFNYDETLRDNLILRLNRLGFNSYLLFLGNNNALQMIYFKKWVH